MKQWNGKKDESVSYKSRNADGIEKTFSDKEIDKIRQYGVRKKRIPLKSLGGN